MRKDLRLQPILPKGKQYFCHQYADIRKKKNRPSLTGAERFLNTFRPIPDQHLPHQASHHQKQNQSA